MTLETFPNGKHCALLSTFHLFVIHQMVMSDKSEIFPKYSAHSVPVLLPTHLLCVVSPSVDQLISSDLVVGTTLGWSHPRQEDAGL